MIVAWDIDHTLVCSDKRPTPVTITTLDTPYLNPVVVGREEEISLLITGRDGKIWRDTYDLVMSLGVKRVSKLCMNPEPNYDQHHIATMKAGYLVDLGATHYVEDNPAYRAVMARYWDGDCISSGEWVRL